MFREHIMVAMALNKVTVVGGKCSSSYPKTSQKIYCFYQARLKGWEGFHEFPALQSIEYYDACSPFVSISDNLISLKYLVCFQSELRVNFEFNLNAFLSSPPLNWNVCLKQMHLWSSFRYILL
jgi:hypothetical protein